MLTVQRKSTGEWVFAPELSREEHMALRGDVQCPNDECRGDAWPVGEDRRGYQQHFKGSHIAGCTKDNDINVLLGRLE